MYNHTMEAWRIGWSPLSPVGAALAYIQDAASQYVILHQLYKSEPDDAQMLELARRGMRMVYRRPAHLCFDRIPGPQIVQAAHRMDVESVRNWPATRQSFDCFLAHLRLESRRKGRTLAALCEEMFHGWNTRPVSRPTPEQQFLYQQYYQQRERVIA